MKRKRSDSLLSKFIILFSVFTIIAVAISASATYMNQTRIYQLQKEESLKDIANSLSSLLQAENENFRIYQDYFLNHYQEMEIPIDFNEEDAALAKVEYERLFASKYPGNVLGKDIAFEDLSPEVQMAYAVYKHEEYLLFFEKAAKNFGLAYAYYIVPTGEPLHMYYILDGVREEKEGSPGLLKLATDVLEPLEEHGKMWEAWQTGKVPDGYDTYDNEYGKTYAWYTPLYIGRQKLGLIGTEIEIESVTREIIFNTLRQLGITAFVLFLLDIVVIWGINYFYISRIRKLIDGVERYAKEKDAGIAAELEGDPQQQDEIAVLGNRISEMILELDNYMQSMVTTVERLMIAKTQVDVMSKVAHRDALTGIRNSTSYKESLKRLEGERRAGKDEFGIAVVDLNNLKRINDTYGHETGNVSIKKCCKMVCTVFTHSPVFRIGGDEFAIILENEDYRNTEELISQLNRQMDELKNDTSLEEWERITAAVGFARYDPSKDDSVSSVFRRADNAMYEKKKKMHAGRSEWERRRK